jgi:hypothetical protein
MAECKPAASSTTPVSSCERIISEFQSQGRPAAPAVNALPGVNVAPQAGEYSIPLEVKTPRVGTGFVEWGTSGWKPESIRPDAPDGTRYNPCGDWLFDKTIAPVGVETDDHNYRQSGKK